MSKSEVVSSNGHVKPLPCPFCRESVSEDSDEVFWFNGEGPPPCYAVRCDNCGAQGPYGYGRERGDHWGAKDEAAKRWNDLPRSAVETSPVRTACDDCKADRDRLRAALREIATGGHSKRGCINIAERELGSPEEPTRRIPPREFDVETHTGLYTEPEKASAYCPDCRSPLCKCPTDE